MILLHQPGIHLSDSLHLLARLTGSRAVTAAQGPEGHTAVGRRRCGSLIPTGHRASLQVQGFGRSAVEGQAAQELSHVAHVHLRELLHVLSQVVALHLPGNSIMGF